MQSHGFRGENVCSRSEALQGEDLMAFPAFPASRPSASCLGGSERAPYWQEE